jgi:hypothetical protein
LNYVDDRTIPLCISCGTELTEREDQDLSGQACNACFRESEAKASAARQAEAADEFRWQSREWFRTSYLERLPLMTRNQFGDLR